MPSPHYDIQAVHAALAALGEPDYTENAEAIQRGAADAAWHLRVELGVTAPVPDLVWERAEELTCEGGRLITLTASHSAGLSVSETGLDERRIRASVVEQSARWWDEQTRQWAYSRFAGSHAYRVMTGCVSVSSVFHDRAPLGLDVDLALKARDSLSQLGRLSLVQIGRWSELWWQDDDNAVKTRNW